MTLSLPMGKSMVRLDRSKTTGSGESTAVSPALVTEAEGEGFFFCSGLVSEVLCLPEFHRRVACSKPILVGSDDEAFGSLLRDETQSGTASMSVELGHSNAYSPSSSSRNSSIRLTETWA